MIDWLLAADIYLTLGGWSDHIQSNKEAYANAKAALIIVKNFIKKD